MQSNFRHNLIESVVGLIVLTVVGALTRLIGPTQIMSGMLAVPLDTEVTWDADKKTYSAAPAVDETAYLVLVKNGSLLDRTFDSQVSGIERPRRIYVRQNEASESLFDKSAQTGVDLDEALRLRHLHVEPGDQLVMVIVGERGARFTQSDVTGAGSSLMPLGVFSVGESMFYAAFAVVIAMALARPARSTAVLFMALLTMTSTSDSDSTPKRDTRREIQIGEVSGNIDFALVSIREDECDAVYERFEPTKVVVGGRQLYSYSQIRNDRGKYVGIALTRCPEQGQGTAQAVVSDLIEELAPRWILLVGIAGAVPDADYCLGDVVLSTRLHDYSISAAIQGKAREFDVRGTPLHPDVEKLLAQSKVVREYLGDWNTDKSLRMEKPGVDLPGSASAGVLYGKLPWRRKVLKSLEAGFPKDEPVRPPLVFPAPIISSDTLLKDADLASQLTETARAAAAIEMEFAGALLAARRHHARQCRVMAIRGISDIVGYKRAAEWTRFACESAASCANQFVRSGVTNLLER